MMDGDRTSVNALFSEDLLEFLASGKSSVAYGIDDERVLKDFHDRELIDVERRVYTSAYTRTFPSTSEVWVMVSFLSEARSFERFYNNRKPT